MRVAIASDHGGVEYKERLRVHLEERGYELNDLGCMGDASVDYPDYALLVARAVASGAAERGVLVCGTGIGMAIAANKVAGVRAANVTSTEFAALCREHNDANVITLSGRFVDYALNEQIVDIFLDTPFAGGRHSRRVGKIARIEQGGQL